MEVQFTEKAEGRRQQQAQPALACSGYRTNSKYRLAIKYSRKTVITTVITADAQCRSVVTNRSYKSDLHKTPTIFSVGTVHPADNTVQALNYALC